MRKIFIKSICSMAIIATMVSLVGCNSNSNVATSATSGDAKVSKNITEPEEIKTVKSKDGLRQITVPKAWETSSEKDEKTLIRLDNKSDDQKISVTLDSKAKLPKNTTIQAYANNIIEPMRKAFKDVNYSPVKQVKVGAYDGVQFTISAKIEKSNITYLITILDDGSNFVRIDLWTNSDKFDESRDLFSQIAYSYK